MTPPLRRPLIPLRTVAATVLLLVLAVGSAAAAPTLSTLLAESGWEAKGTRDHKDSGLEITIDHKWVGELPCLRGMTTAEVSPEALLAAATDIPSATRWSSAPLSASRVLGRGADSIDYYQHLDIPGWTGAKDRYWVLRGRVKRDAGVLRFQWERFDGRTPYPDLSAELAADHPSAIEPPTNLGEWRFTPKDGGMTEVRYYVCSDSGGKLPSALERVAALQTLPDAVADLIVEGRKRGR
jgi:hypothetical protein